jgi:hypothetical protein
MSVCCHRGQWTFSEIPPGSFLNRHYATFAMRPNGKKLLHLAIIFRCTVDAQYRTKEQCCGPSIERPAFRITPDCPAGRLSVLDHTNCREEY